jgi:NAD(P)-dependent dehydrogenase (short-subunit alcohol dehydrogenase family)
MSVPDRFSLAGSVAVVTGASSGLGAGFVLALADAGADVVLGARRAEPLQALVERIEQDGRRALAWPTDVADPASCDRLVAAAMERFGQVDVLVNNAGVGTAVPALRETPEEFRQVIDVNLLAPNLVRGGFGRGGLGWGWRDGGRSGGSCGGGPRRTHARNPPLIDAIMIPGS